MNASLEKLSGPGGGMAQCLARSVVDTLVGAACLSSGRQATLHANK